MKKKIILGFLIILGLLLLLSSYYLYNLHFKKYELNNFIIKKGDNFNKILKNAGLENDIYIRAILKEKDYSRSIKPGKYVFEEKLRLKQFFEKIVNGESEKIKFTIPEGYTINQIKEKLYKNGFINKKKFDLQIKNIDFEYFRNNNSLEGYLYPDTYYFYKEMSEIEIINIILDRFRKEYPLNNIKDKKKFYINLIIASIIEKEAYYKEEQDLISSVFHNRIDKNHKLESCSTIAYISDYKITKITNKELEIDSPYNTYKYKGLPPTPISNPGNSAIKAAKNPRDTEYFYFILGSNNKHIFSKTYKEHLKNKYKTEENRK